jgi:hypothetical protein
MTKILGFMREVAMREIGVWTSSAMRPAVIRKWSVVQNSYSLIGLLLPMIDIYLYHYLHFRKALDAIHHACPPDM